MNNETKNIMELVRSTTGLNVVGATSHKLAHRIKYKVFILSGATENELNQLADKVGLPRTFSFIRSGKFKHGANWIFDYEIKHCDYGCSFG